MIVSMIESVGDYYTCARVSGAPPPTPGIISRGLAAEGVSVMVAGLFRQGAGSTSSSGDIAIVALTGVASRAVLQVAALLLMVVGTLGKVSATLASLPPGIVGGVFCVVLASLVAVGWTNLQFVSMRQDRNVFILGFCLFNSLSIAGPGGYFSTIDHNPFLFGTDSSSSSVWADIGLALCSSPMVISLVVALVLDNTIPATARDRGLHAWSRARHAQVHNDADYVQTYSLPWPRLCCGNCGYLEACHGGIWPEPPVDNVWEGGHGDLWHFWWPPTKPFHRNNHHNSDSNTTRALLERQQQPQQQPQPSLSSQQRDGPPVRPLTEQELEVELQSYYST